MLVAEPYPSRSAGPSGFGIRNRSCLIPSIISGLVTECPWSYGIIAAGFVVVGGLRLECEERGADGKLPGMAHG